MSGHRFESDGTDLAPKLRPLLLFLDEVPCPATARDAVASLVQARTIFPDCPPPTERHLEAMVQLAEYEVAAIAIDTWTTPWHEVLKQAIYLYTMEQPFPLYMFCNAPLNSKDPTVRTPSFLAAYSPYYKLLMTACMALPPSLQYSGHAWRIVRVTPDRPDTVDMFQNSSTRFTVGNRISFGAFTSMTINPNVVKEFSSGSSQVIVLKCPNVQGFRIAPLSAYAEAEAEILVLPPTSFTVSAPPVTAHTVVIVDLDYVHPSPGQYMTVAPPAPTLPKLNDPTIGSTPQPSLGRPTAKDPFVVLLEALHRGLRVVDAQGWHRAGEDMAELLAMIEACIASPPSSRDAHIEPLLHRMFGIISGRGNIPARRGAFARPEVAAIVCSVIPRPSTTGSSLLASFRLVRYSCQRSNFDDDTNTRLNIFGTPAFAAAVCSAIPRATSFEGSGYVFDVVAYVCQDSGNAADTNSRRNTFGTPSFAAAVCSVLQRDDSTSKLFESVMALIRVVTEDTGSGVDAWTRRDAYRVALVKCGNMEALKELESLLRDASPAPAAGAPVVAAHAHDSSVRSPVTTPDPMQFDSTTDPAHIPLSMLPQFVRMVMSADPAAQMHGTMMIRKLLSVEVNPPIDEVIATNIVPYFVEFLARDENPRIQFESAWALTNIVSGTAEHTTLVIQANAVPHFVRLLASPSDDVREQSTWALGNIAGDSAKCRDYILNLGVMKPLLTLMTTPNLKSSILRNALHTCRNLCRGKPNPELHKVAVALPVLIDLLNNHPDGEVVTDACWAVSYISDGPNDRAQAFLNSGGLPRVVQLLSSAATTQQTPAIRTIGNIVTGTDAQTQVVINAGALPAFRLLLNHPKRSIRKETCWAISNITAGNRNQIQACINANLIPGVMKCMLAAEVEVKKEAVWVIAKATAGGSKEQIRYIVDHDVMSRLTQMLSLYDAKIVVVALEALYNILQSAEGDEQNVYADMLMENGGLDAIEGLQQHSCNEVRDHAHEILTTFFETEEDDWTT